MELREQQTGNLITEGEFKSKFPDTSFPLVINEETYNAFGFDIVLEGPQAVTVAPYGTSQRDGVELIDGKWYTKFISGPVFTLNEQGTPEVQEAAYKASMDAVQASVVRSTRTEKLKESDWTQVADSPVDQVKWKEYRQELRDITDQVGFPWNVTWPVEP